MVDIRSGPDPNRPAWGPWRGLRAIHRQPGPVARVVIVVDATASRQHPAGFAATLRVAVPGVAVVILERDAALTMPGVVDLPRLSASSLPTVVNVLQCFGVQEVFGVLAVPSRSMASCAG